MGTITADEINFQQLLDRSGRLCMEDISFNILKLRAALKEMEELYNRLQRNRLISCRAYEMQIFCFMTYFDFSYWLSFKEKCSIPFLWIFCDHSAKITGNFDCFQKYWWICFKAIWERFASVAWSDWYRAESKVLWKFFKAFTICKSF